MSGIVTSYHWLTGRRIGNGRGLGVHAAGVLEVGRGDGPAHPQVLTAQVKLVHRVDRILHDGKK